MIRRILSVFLSLALLLSLCLFTSCGGNATYMTVGTEKVSYDMVRSFVLSHRAAYTEEELRDEAVREEIREKVLTDLRMAYVVLNVARELDLGLTDELEDGIEADYEYFSEQGDEFDKMLEAQYATKKVFKTLLTISAYDTLLFDAITEGGALGDDRFLTTNDVIDADIAKGDWYAAEYIVVAQQDKATKSIMEKAREALLAGATFKEASADIEKSYAANLRYRAVDECFTSTIYSEEFEDAVKSLEIGGVSEVIASYTSDGRPCYMLIRRMALSDEYIDEHYNDVIAQYLTREYAAYMKERAMSLTVTVAKKYRDVDLLDIE